MKTGLSISRRAGLLAGSLLAAPGVALAEAPAAQAPAAAPAAAASHHAAAPACFDPRPACAMTVNPAFDHPELVADKKTAYLSWVTHEEGYRLLPLPRDEKSAAAQ
jgi:hypothetical protein